MAKLKKNTKTLVESWAPMITRTTGVKDPEKLEWMSVLAHNQVLNEADGYAGGYGTTGAYGGTQQGAAGAMGGVYSPYSTLYNTLGVGNVVPTPVATMTGAEQADGRNLGSGDKFPALLPLALKVAAKTIGFELVNTTPLAGPSGVLPYMDYVYAGSKQPFGATPAYGMDNANPAQFQTQSPAASLYGLPYAFKATPDASTDTDTLKTALQAAATVDDATGKIKAIKIGGAYKKNGTTVDTTALEDDSANTLIVKYIGTSRIDGDPMFQIVSGVKSLADYFSTGSAVITIDGTPAGNLVGPRLISMLEDNIQGYTGSGKNDTDPWYGTYQNGKHLYEPMSRATGELQYARQLSLQVFTKSVQVGTIAVSVAVTQEQVSDLQKQWGIDVVKMVENAGINELSATINRHITSRLFGLGWKNHIKLVEVEGEVANMNVTVDANATRTEAWAFPQTNDNATDVDAVQHEAHKDMPYKYIGLHSTGSAAYFENKDVVMKRVQEQFLKASNWILQRGRFGAATFAVTNITVATALQTNAQYAFSPLANSISQNGNSLYPVGTMFGMTIYVDPLMAGNDCRVLVGRKGGKDEPGVHFCPYLMAESVKMIAEGTAAPKVVIKSRYALIDAGFFPETQYLTFEVNLGEFA